MQTVVDIDFQLIAPEQFEELCFDLLMACDFQRLTWRQGGGDSGRDIQGVREVPSALVEPFNETWFFECKRYATGVPPEDLNSKIAWADAERPNHLVFLISSHLTNPARDWIDKIRATKHYRIHVVEGKQLRLLVGRFSNLVTRYFASDIQRLMQDAHRAWLFHNLVPEPGTLRRLAAFDHMDEFTVPQIAFLWASLKIRAKEVTKDMEDSAPEEYGHLFTKLKLNATTIRSVLEGAEEWSLINVVEEILLYEPVYSKTFAVEIAHIVDNTERIALYCLVRDGDGEGLEVLVDQDSSLTCAIHHIPNGARDALAGAKRMLKIS